METDYLIIGAGTTGLAFADTLLEHSSDSMLIVDRRATAGGHWVDSYPFVELHQPASFYGMPSRKLGSEQKSTDGTNKGLEALATGTEVLEHLQGCLRERLLASGRVTFLPLHEVTEDRRVRSLLSAQTYDVEIRKKLVNAAYFENAVPKTHKRAYRIDPSVDIVPISDAPQHAPGHDHFLVVGAGKTGIDAVLFLLRSGARPDQISWVMPRDSWLINREHTQPTTAFFETTMGSFASQLEAAATAKDARDYAHQLEACGYFMRIDPAIEPEIYHGATCTRLELDLIRQVKNILRKGRVKEITSTEIVLEHGVEPLPGKTLVIDCSASAISKLPTKKIFDGDIITCQLVRFPLISFSASFLGYLEATRRGDDEKNRFASPVPLPDRIEDMPLAVLMGLMNQGQWRQDEEISAFIQSSRLEPFGALAASADLSKPAHAEILGRIKQALIPAVMNLQEIAS